MKTTDSQMDDNIYFLRPTFLASESKKKYFESEKKYFESKKKYF